MSPLNKNTRNAITPKKCGVDSYFFTDNQHAENNGALSSQSHSASNKLKVVFHSRKKIFSLSWTEIAFAPLHRPSINNINYTFD